MSEQACHQTKVVTPSCCGPEPSEQTSSCHSSKARPDYLLWGSFAIVALLYLQYAFLPESTTVTGWYQTMASSAHELINTMWWGILLGILMLAALSKVPREFVMSVLGAHSGLNGILRATAAGVLLDLCNHGILMVGAKLYERGASIGQVMAFLIASPWNSFSLTIILIALIGIPWTLAFIALSMIIAVITGMLFDALTARGALPKNPNQVELPDGFRFWTEARKQLKATRFTPAFLGDMLVSGLKDSRMVMRWLLFGVVLASAIRAFVSPETFGSYFGPTVMGLALTIVAATIIEVCSEGSTPIAADLVTRASAPGNGFAFLMTGATTDYTEVMVLKDTTKSWKIALFLPLLTVPQVILLAWLMNQFAM